MGLFLICAGAYVAPELAAEFGRLPPSFLPVGNRRLYVLQREAIGDAAERVCMSVPEDFDVPAHDRDQLERLGIELIPVPNGLSLGQSVVYCINVTAAAQGSVRILHGDTLIRGVDFGAPDAVSVGDTSDYYHWAGFEGEADGIRAVYDTLPASGGVRRVLSGYFHFADAARFVQCVMRARSDFVGGMDLYTRHSPLHPLETGDWLDFGHLHTFYRSRSRITTQRAFNRLAIGPHTVVKSSPDTAKVAAEAAWYKALPGTLRPFTPALVGEETGAYALEYLYLSPLNDLFVFGRLPAVVWQRILAACAEFLDACAAHPPPPGNQAAEAAGAAALYGAKTEERLRRFAATRGIDPARPWRINGRPVPGLLEMARRAAALVPAPRPDDVRLVHGDFGFSNIFYDFRTQRVRAVDPRGQDGHGRATPYGDPRYDVAKLHHSVVGRYDFIVAGCCTLRRPSAYALELELPDHGALAEVEALFRASRFAGQVPEETAAPAIAVLLFLSMLPLHADAPDRQDALLANAMRLFLDLEGDLERAGA
ncbi:MAG TPA: hypothetical protein VD995_09160 [Azospirillum sp.]|nr:hypothetical protein [Azospirillum sp.]